MEEPLSEQVKPRASRAPRYVWKPEDVTITPPDEDEDEEDEDEEEDEA